MRKVQSYAFLLAGIFILWFAAEARIKPTEGKGRIIEDFKEIPLQIGSWSGVDIPMDDVTLKALKHCAFLNREYEDEHGYDCYITMVYGVDLGDFHQPEVCMQGQGWKIISSRSVKVSSEKPHRAMIVHMVNDEGHIVMLYWFASKDGATTALGSHKVFAFSERLKNRELKPSALVRLISPIEGDVKDAEKTALGLAAVADPYIMKTLADPPVFENSDELLLEE
jgi:EpsI family protein